MYSIKVRISLSLAALMLAAAAFPALLEGSPGFEEEEPVLRKPDDFVYRNSPAAGDIDALTSKAQEIDSHYRSWREDGEKHVSLSTDYHAVFPFPIERLIPIFLDHENEDQVYPRITYSRDLSPHKATDEAHFQEVKINFKFLGIGAEYHYIVYRVPTWYDDGGFSVHWSLAHSFGNKYAELYGSWYLKELEGEARQGTYIRNFVLTELIDPLPFLKPFTEMFGEKSVQNFFKAAYRAAESSQKTAQSE